MSKFKVGDKVKVISTDYCFADSNLGRVGTVIRYMTNDYPRVKFNPKDKMGNKNSYYYEEDYGRESELELVKKNSKTTKKGAMKITQPREFTVGGDDFELEVEYCEGFNVSLSDSKSEFSNLEELEEYIKALKMAYDHLKQLRDGDKKPAKRKVGRPRKK